MSLLTNHVLIYPDFRHTFPPPYPDALAFLPPSPSCRPFISPQISVNLAPGAKADFTLIYEELLVRRLGSYNLVVHLNPGQIVEDLRIQVSLDESRPLEFVDVSDIETSDLIPFKEKRKPEVANVAHVNYISPSQVIIGFTCDIGRTS